MTYHYTDPDGDRLHVTPTTRHGQPAINVRTARNDSKSSAAVDIPIDQLEDVVDGLRAVRREAVGAHPGIRPLQPEEQGTSVDWQAIARDRERELKTAGEARQRAETAIARVRAVVGELAATNAAGALGDGHEDAAARIRAALDEPSAPAATEATEPIVDRPFRSHRQPVNPTTPQVLAEVGYERTRQDTKWGEQNHPDGTGQYPETVDADIARRACQNAAEGGYLDWLHILREEVAEAFAETDPTRLRAELIQVAATAVNWIEAIDRRNNTT